MSEEKLKSKKNEVYRRERTVNGKTYDVVEKEFTDAKRFHMEHTIHGLLSKGGVPVARLLGVEAPSGEFRGKLIYEFIDGDIVLELLSDGHVVKEALLRTVDWMKRFYMATPCEPGGGQWLLGDIHLRNFIYRREGREVYGIDFEDAEIGIIERDVGKLFLYIATYEPEYSKPHLEAAEFFLNRAIAEFQLDKARLLNAAADESHLMAERRGAEIKTDLLIPMMERNFK